MAKKSKKLSFRKIVLLYKYTNSAVGDLARDILYDENFPFRASISNQKQYLEEQGFFKLDIFEEKRESLPKSRKYITAIKRP